jgi:hypothetical protein
MNLADRLVVGDVRIKPAHDDRVDQIDRELL